MGKSMQYVRRVAVLVGVMGIGVACSGPAPSSDGPSVSEPVGTRSDAIINGQLDTTHHAVVLPYCGEVGLCVCSGTLVKKDEATGIGWIATAAHCLPDGLGGALRFYLQGDKAATFIKDKPAQVEPGTIRYPVIDFVRHPDFTGATQLPSGTQLNDIAIVRVMGVGPESPVIPLAPSPDTVEVGASIVDVGYGSTGKAMDLDDIYGKSGTRRRSDVTVSALTDNFVIADTSQSGGSVNVGDSGGPTVGMVNGANHVIAVHSTVNVLLGKSYSTRVSGKLNWVDGEIAKTPEIGDCGSCIQNVTGGVRACSALYRTCLDDADCNVYAHCMEDCGKANKAGPTKECRDKCGAEKPNAAPLYDASLTCGCQTCSAACGAVCPAGSSSPDASAPSGPSSSGSNPGNPSPAGEGDGSAPPADTGCTVARASGPTGSPIVLAVFAAVVVLAGRRRRTTLRPKAR